MNCMIAQLNEWVKGHVGSIHGSEHTLSSFNMSSDRHPYKYGPSLQQERWWMNARRRKGGFCHHQDWSGFGQCGLRELVHQNPPFLCSGKVTWNKGVQDLLEEPFYNFLTVFSYKYKSIGKEQSKPGYTSTNTKNGYEFARQRVWCHYTARETWVPCTDQPTTELTVCQLYSGPGWLTVWVFGVATRSPVFLLTVVKKYIFPSWPLYITFHSVLHARVVVKHWMTPF